MYESKFELFWNDIPTERKEAVTYAVLQMWWGLNEREVRRALHELSGYDNGDNYVLIRSGRCKGFYKTDDESEITAYKRECLNKGRSVFAPIKKINRILKANTTQFSLVNNLRVVRESLKIKQKDVCAFMKDFDAAFNEPMLSKMENGACLPTPFQLLKLSEFYGCDPADLVKSELYY